MGTTLHGLGLPMDEAADPWVDTQPEDVLAVHRAFVGAGAQVVRTATLCSRPDGADDPEAVTARLHRAVSLARTSGAQEVWLSLGPLGPSRGGLNGLEACLSADADRVVLETFVDPVELLEAVSYLASRGGSVVASLAPGPQGLLAGVPYPTQALRDAGASCLGINCGADPHHALQLFRQARDDGDWFVAPAWGAALPDVWRALHGEVHWLGGCCGVSPTHWGAAWPR